MLSHAVEKPFKQQQELAVNQATAEKQAKAGEASLDSVMQQMDTTCSVDKTSEELEREAREKWYADFIKASIAKLMHLMKM